MMLQLTFMNILEIKKIKMYYSIHFFIILTLSITPTIIFREIDNIKLYIPILNKENIIKNNILS